MTQAGHAALILSFVLTSVSVILFLIAQVKKNSTAYTAGRACVGMTAMGLTVSAGVLAYLFLTNTYNLEYPTSYNTLSLAWYYKLSVLWAGQAGSFMTWAVSLSLFTACLLRVDRRNKSGLMPVSFVVLGFVQAIFVALMLFSPADRAANPYEPLRPFASSVTFDDTRAHVHGSQAALDRANQRARAVNATSVRLDAQFRLAEVLPTRYHYKGGVTETRDSNFASMTGLAVQVTPKPGELYEEQPIRYELLQPNMSFAELLHKDSPFSAEQIAEAVRRDGSWTGAVYIKRGKVRTMEEQVAKYFGAKAIEQQLNTGTRLAALVQVAGHGEHGEGYIASFRWLRGLKPQLRNIGMFYHPPTLLIGYAGFAIPFALAIAALVIGRIDRKWLDFARPFTFVSWLFLGAGNLLGGLWAYEELGWGGYWKWDPVENASFMPWLLASALLHSGLMSQRRRILRFWSITLAVLTFWMTILGTFLTRSGFVQSVHAFEKNDFFTLIFGIFLGLILMVSFLLILLRSGTIGRSPKILGLDTREGIFLVLNVFMVLFTFMILYGTLFPRVAELIGGQKKDLGETWFNTYVGIPAGLLLGLLLIVGQASPWTKPNTRKMLDSLIIPIIFFIVGVGLTLLFFRYSLSVPLAILMIGLASAVLGGVGQKLYTTARRGTLLTNPRAYAGYVVHIGIAMILIGIAGSSGLNWSHLGQASKVKGNPTRETANVSTGQVTKVSEYEVVVNGIDFAYNKADDAIVGTADLTLFREGEQVGRLSPYASIYYLHGHSDHDPPVSEVVIRSSIRDDFYVLYKGYAYKWKQGHDENGNLKVDKDGNGLGNNFLVLDKNKQPVHAFGFIVNPLVNWIWWGGIFFLLGAVAALWPKQRKPVDEPDPFAAKKATAARHQPVAATTDDL